MLLLLTNFEITLVVALFIILAFSALIIYELNGIKKRLQNDNNTDKEILKLKLQALERLTLFVDRNGLQNLVSRSDLQGISAAQLHQTLNETIRAEYDYNISQQIYISTEMWNAITRLKDQNVFIINQLAAPLPHNAMAIDLSKRILEYSMQENAELNIVVLDALRYEAKKILE